MQTTKLPKHIAIIMDGNGRWATAQRLPRHHGHHRGVETAENIIDATLHLGIPYLTLFAFSEENWQRPPEEISTVMELLRLYLETREEKMIRNGIRFRSIGDITRLSNEVQQVVHRVEETTKEQKKMTLILALSYGSRSEIVRAINNGLQKGWKKDEVITEEEFQKYLDTRDFPDPDLLIRTSGEYRISNYLLWQLAYTELYFTKKMWPDFTENDLQEALKEFSRRERRYGKVL